MACVYDAMSQKAHVAGPLVLRTPIGLLLGYLCYEVDSAAYSFWGKHIVGHCLYQKLKINKMCYKIRTSTKQKKKK